MIPERYEKLEMLEGSYCYELHVFSENIMCPDYEGANSRDPKCCRFGVSLVWNISGRVLKCEPCLKGVIDDSRNTAS